MKLTHLKIAILLVVLVAVVFIICLMGYNGNIVQNGIKMFSENAQGNIGQKLFLAIDNGNGSPQNFEADFKEGMTAFQLLKNKTDALGIVLETKTYDYGVFIEKIGDKKNGDDGKYWLYYVDGEMPQVAADKEELRSGDRVEFKFEKSQF